MNYNNLMDFNTFAKFVKENISDYLDEDEQWTVTLGNVIKNNGVNKTSLNIMRQDTYQCPIIYLEEFYEKYRNRESLDDILEHISNLYQYNFNSKYSLSDDTISNYEKIKGKIICRLINYEKNKEILKESPHIRILDLALTYRILFDQTEVGIATTLINYGMVQTWGVDEEILHQESIKNSTQYFPPTIERMIDVIKGLMDSCAGKPYELERIIEGMETENESGDTKYEAMPMFILSNASKLNGAGALFYSDILKEFANLLKKDIYILPSSIHEVILIPHSENINTDELKKIVIDANDKVVLEDEILSNHIYLYSLSKDKISISA